VRRTDVVVRPDGLIAASGHLTLQGADLVRGAADQLRGTGHSRIVVDLRDVRTTDDAGLAILHQLRRDFAADGGELLIRG
jgi:anti-anti-sigma regulatory factor